MLPVATEILSRALDNDFAAEQSHALACDGSDRRYFRLWSKDQKTSFILMKLYNPLDIELLKSHRYPWVLIAEAIAREIRIPRIKKILPDQGALIIEDLGNNALKAELNKLLAQKDISKVFSLYEKTFAILTNFLELEQESKTPWKNVQFTAKKFFLELLFFKEKFLERCLTSGLSSKDQGLFLKEALALCQYIGQLPRAFCHRDFHANNLMITSKGEIGVLDFQDARLGPLAYDLVSLCFDSYVALTPDERLRLLDSAIKHFSHPNLREELFSSWQACFIQRQYKALGSFAFLTLEKNKGNYLLNASAALSCFPQLENTRWPFLTKTLPAYIEETYPK